MKAKKTIVDSIALLLQGGGALGAYQAGVFEALLEAGLEPDWVAGISIGAINAAIIAGNAPEERLPRLREFWEEVTVDNLHFIPPILKALLTRDDTEHQLLNAMSTLRTLFFGISGFFTPRPPTSWLAPKGTKEAVSFCDSAPLKATLERLVDFDRINGDDMRFTIGAVNIASGNFTRFDNNETTITPEHVMASGALPPGFPPVKIGDDYFWDGGLISNTPLQWLLNDKLNRDTLMFQVDLWSADGALPQNMAEVLTRRKDIQYSSRTRANTDRFREQHKLHHAIAELMKKLPDTIKQLPEAKPFRDYADPNVYNIVHLIYHNKPYEGYSKDFEFSRLSMELHWRAGYEDTVKTLKHPEVLQRPHNKEGIAIFDFSREEPSAKKKKAAA